MGATIMESIAADLAQRLAACAEAVCHHYLPNGVRCGSYWIVGDVSGAKGRSLYVRLRSSSGAAAGNWTENVALPVMLRRLVQGLSAQSDAGNAAT